MRFFTAAVSIFPQKTPSLLTNEPGGWRYLEAFTAGYYLPYSQPFD